MDILNHYRQIICITLQPYTEINYANVNVRNLAVFDPANDQYAILSEGWEGNRHYHGCLIHIEIREGKIWVQRDGTEDGIANELIANGIPKEAIVLGFQEPSVRPHTGFAIA
ncbi:XisI protein [Synechocystis sp. FACHB-383]|uniref:XisI protein n=1 Tax=unclassified Synechocystis TaxID=2640012 RepID=UPI00168361E5|nr:MULTISPECIES: XisI protein [unclassified Synechocystis]MBD2653868.1 XisI protein [Synechocystis sp. FACHB-383]MBE9195313.1 XisI protein [Synechocystis sp. LEGE 06083]